MKVELNQQQTLDTLQTLIELNNILKIYLIQFPINFPLNINNSSPNQEILNFLMIQSHMIEFFQKQHPIKDCDLHSTDTFSIIKGNLKYFFKIENKKLIPNLDLLVQNHITNTQKVENIICNLPLYTKLQILEIIQKQYNYVNGSIFIGYLILDLQPAINHQLCDVPYNPIQTITLDGIYIDYQNSTKSPLHLKYYLHIISTNKHIQNKELQNSLFYLASKVPHFIEIYTGFWNQFHQVQQFNHDQLLLDLLKEIPSFLYNIMINTPKGFNEIKQDVEIVLNQHVFAKQLICQDLFANMLKQSSFSSEHKSKILQLTNQSRVKKYKYKLLNILLIVSHFQFNQSYKNIIELFLDNQEVSNHGAKKFAKLCEHILHATKINTVFTEISSQNPSEIIKIIKSQILQSALVMINSDKDLNSFAQEDQEKITQIIDPLSYLINITNTEYIKKILIAHITNTPQSIKVKSSIQSQEFNTQVIQNFLQPCRIQDENIVTETVFDLSQILQIGNQPVLTCINYINGSQKEELIALSFLNDRIVIQSKSNNIVYARAIMKLIKSQVSQSTYGIILDNYYGEDKYLINMIELLKVKTQRDNFNLLLPLKVNNIKTQDILKKFISTIKVYRYTTEYNLDFSSTFSTNQSDILSNTLIEVIA